MTDLLPRIMGSVIQYSFRFGKQPTLLILPPQSYTTLMRELFQRNHNPGDGMFSDISISGVVLKIIPATSMDDDYCLACDFMTPKNTEV